MKKWYRAIPVKIILFVLCITAFCTAAACVVGVAAMVENGVYRYTEQYVVQSDWYSRMESDAYSIVYETVHGYSSLARYEADATNLRYAVFTAQDTVVESNLEDPLAVETWDHSFYFGVYSDQYGMHIEPITPEMSAENTYTVRAYVVSGLPVQDAYAFDAQLYAFVYAVRYAVFPIGIVSVLLCFVSFIMLMCVSGRKRGDEELHPGYFYRVPFDLLLVFAALFIAFAAELIVYVFYTGELAAILLLVILALFTLCAGVLLCMSLACRIKGKTLAQNTVIAMICRLVWRTAKWCARRIAVLFRAIPMIWRTLLVAVASVFVDFVILSAAYNGSDFAIFIWFFKTVFVTCAALYAALFMRELQKGGRALAKGELSYRVDTRMMFWDFKRHGEDLNSISEGMALAVDQQLKSERMKAELITNVSHDIKTPLTSIINYASLVASEPCNNDKHREYADVLLRRSEHLKRLLEDLVEISKANTGNLEIDLQPMDACVFLSQTAGEFVGRCETAGLTLVTAIPEDKIEIMADGRRIWRVFENLMGNAIKYSLPGSRVYLDLKAEEGQAVFTLRNTSKDALNISPKELTERFVRGDTSRSTEGNGLGLSIADSLVGLQNGKMEITIDGDLFKVTLRFPVAE